MSSNRPTENGKRPKHRQTGSFRRFERGDGKPPLFTLTTARRAAGSGRGADSTPISVILGSPVLYARMYCSVNPTHYRPIQGRRGTLAACVPVTRVADARPAVSTASTAEHDQPLICASDPEVPTDGERALAASDGVVITCTSGRCFWNRFTPALVTGVPFTHIHSRFCKPSNEANPSSVMCVPPMFSRFRRTSLRRLGTPASLIGDPPAASAVTVSGIAARASSETTRLVRSRKVPG